MITRRSVLLGAAGLMSAPMVIRDLSAQTNEIRIAAVTSQTGPFVLQGEETLRAIAFAIDEANAQGGILGRQVVMRAGDDEGTPEAGRRVAERLALQGYRLITGPISSAVSLALGAQLDRWNALYVVNNSKADRITGDGCRARMVRCVQSDSMDFRMAGPWLAGQPGSRVAVIAGDYAWGRSSAEGFIAAAKAAAREAVAPIFTPVGTRDFAPYITQLRDGPADLIWIALVGQDAINFGQQAGSFGLLSRKTVFGHHLLLAQFLQALGGTLAGVWGNLPWSPEVETAATRDFVTAWQAKFARLPAENEATAYLATRIILDAVRRAGSDEPAEVLARTRGGTFDTLLGSCRIRPEDNQMEMPNVLARVTEVDGRWRAKLQRLFTAAEVTPPPSPACQLRA